MSGINNNCYEFMGRLHFGMIREGYVEKVRIQQALMNGLELNEERETWETCQKCRERRSVSYISNE